MNATEQLRREPAEMRLYPYACTSAVCGRIEHDGCPMAKELADFRAWVAATDAYVPDPVWSPRFFVARRPASAKR